MHEERDILRISGEFTKADLIETLKGIPDNAHIYIELHYRNNSNEDVTEVANIRRISSLRFSVSDDIRSVVYLHTSNLRG